MKRIRYHWMATPVAAFVLAFAAFSSSAQTHKTRQPVIDMHLHAYQADRFGPPGQTMCQPYDYWPARDPGEPIGQYLELYNRTPDCARKTQAPMTTDELRNRSIAELERLNIIAVTSGLPADVERWYKQAPDRIIPALHMGLGELPSIADLRQLHADGRLKVLGEIVPHGGIEANDPRLEPYYALAEELDVPVSIHIGINAPGIAYFGNPKFRAHSEDALLLEEVLLRHPKMRVYASHAGYPLGDNMIALMIAHPQVYVDTAAIDFILPKAEFHRYLRRLVEAGFARRIMFGSDNMLWPGVIATALENIENADFLTPAQKRDILYNNAARFLRLEK